MIIRSLLSAALMLAALPSGAATVTYTFSSGPMALEYSRQSGWPKKIRSHSVAVTFDQDFAPVSLAGATVRVGGLVDVYSVELISKDVVYSTSPRSGQELLDVQFVKSFDCYDCEVEGYLSMHITKSGDAHWFTYFGSGDPDYFMMGTHNSPEGSGENYSSVVFGYTAHTIYSTRKRPTVTREGDVIGAAPIPLPASISTLGGAMALLAFAGFGTQRRRRAKG